MVGWLGCWLVVVWLNEVKENAGSLYTLLNPFSPLGNFHPLLQLGNLLEWVQKILE